MERRKGDGNDDVEMEMEVGKEDGEEAVGDGGWIEVAVDMPGQKDDDAMVVFLGEMIREGLIADGFLQDRLIINNRWHWRLYIDVCKPSPSPPV